MSSLFFRCSQHHPRQRQRQAARRALALGQMSEDEQLAFAMNESFATEARERERLLRQKKAAPAPPAPRKLVSEREYADALRKAMQESLDEAQESIAVNFARIATAPKATVPEDDELDLLADKCEPLAGDDSSDDEDAVAEVKALSLECHDPPAAGRDDDAECSAPPQDVMLASVVTIAAPTWHLVIKLRNK